MGGWHMHQHKTLPAADYVKHRSPSLSLSPARRSAQARRIPFDFKPRAGRSLATGPREGIHLAGERDTEYRRHVGSALATRYRRLLVRWRALLRDLFRFWPPWQIGPATGRINPHSASKPHAVGWSGVSLFS